MLYPNIQAKAQEELDRVVGRKRLPDFSDEEDLPYIRAICFELLRWNPITPIGVPHRNIEEDEYRGMLIPMGSSVITNIWCVMISIKCLLQPKLVVRAMLNNKDVYGPQDVTKFEPERFLREGIKDPYATFGFGRRYKFV